jgi:hypothetical protein
MLVSIFLVSVVVTLKVLGNAMKNKPAPIKVRSTYRKS